MWKKAMWVGVPREEIEEKKIYQGDMNGRFAYYRLEIELEEAGEAIVDLSANSRYRLWINEKPVLSGPCRSNQFRHYYETVDLKPYRKKEKISWQPKCFSMTVCIPPAGRIRGRLWSAWLPFQPATGLPWRAP